MNVDIIKFIKNEVSGWKLSEALWLFLSCGIICALSIYLGDSIVGIVSAVTGVAYVVCNGKGKLCAYIFGAVNCVLYSIISCKAQLYGETMLNALYYLPMQFVGFFVWSKHMNDETKEVEKHHMKNKGRIVTVLSICALTFLYGLLLLRLGDKMPFIDSFTTSASVVAMIVTIKMYSEQWWIWTAVNSVSIYMWWCDFKSGSDNMATLLMWVVYLATGIIMLYKWEKEIKQNRKRGTI
ncbi:MAG: nicotinamide mononucleotide transporter [Clostridia bacterium]|nr:nicotinamide mononucleotide transporter [Clostridia bacterium]